MYNISPATWSQMIKINICLDALALYDLNDNDENIIKFNKHTLNITIALINSLERESMFNATFNNIRSYNSLEDKQVSF